MKRNRGISAGTVLMLALTVLTLGGFFAVAGRLGGSGMDLTQERMSALRLETAEQADPGEVRLSDETQGTAAARNAGEAQPAGSRTAPADEDATESGGPAELVLTFGGTVAAEENIRKSAYSSDSQKYDFSLVMNLLRDVFQGDGSAVFLENLLMENTKVSATVVPAEAADMLSEAGVTMAAAGFSKVWDKEFAGVLATRQALMNRGVKPLGIHEAETDEPWAMVRSGDLSVAVISFTDMLSASAKKAMAKQGLEYAVAEADSAKISESIQAARAQGAQAVIVLLNWGKAGGKSPEKAQKALAWQIAEAGADLIIGAGSRVPQAPEWLSVTGTDGSTRKVLCAYSLGTLISDNRKQINRLSSYVLKVTFRQEAGGAAISDLAYVPTYLWRYRQDGVYYYRCLAANRTPPDGMDSDQQQNMAKAAEQIAETLKDSSIRVLPQP